MRGEKEKEKSCIILSNGNVLCVSSFLDSSLLLIFVSLFPLMLHQNKPIITSNNLLSTYFQLVVFFCIFLFALCWAVFQMYQQCLLHGRLHYPCAIPIAFFTLGVINNNENVLFEYSMLVIFRDEVIIINVSN